MFTRDISHSSTDHYTIHQSQLSTLIRIPDAITVQLEQLSNETICEAKQRTLDVKVKEYSQFGEDEILIALIQLSPYSYLIYQQNHTLIFKNNDNITTYQFMMDTSQYIQMIKLNQDVLILSNSEAYILDIETFGKESIIYQEVSQWQKRDFRKLTKLFNHTNQQFVLSAIGINGLEIYIVRDRTLQFLRSVQNYKNIVDFTIVNNDLFILDAVLGLTWYQVDESLNTSIKVIDTLDGGLAVDSYNGVNVFVAYKWARYAVVEYVVNSTTKYWYKHNMIYTRKIFDVDATQDFAIVQGVSHHLILFNYHQSEEKTTLRHFQLRDFQLYYEGSRVFFSGITSKSFVLSELTFAPARILCFSDTLRHSSYRLIYTTLVSKTTLNRHIQPIEVTVVDTYYYEESMIFIIIGVASGVILVIVMVLYMLTRNRNFNQQIVILENTISKKEYKLQNQLQEAPQLIQSNLMSVRESKDQDFLNIKQ